MLGFSVRNINDVFIVSLDAWVAINGVKSLDSQRKNATNFSVLAKLKFLALANFCQI